MGGTTIGTKALREFERRAATQRREAKARRDGSSGPASSCRLIDPQSGAVLGEYQPHQFEPPAAQLALTTTLPKVHRSIWKHAECQHRGRARHHMGDRQKLDGQDSRLAPCPPTNPSTLRSRRAREIEKRNRRDPLRAYMVWLPTSVMDKLIVRFKPVRPEVRDGVFSKQAWDNFFSEVLKEIVVEAIARQKR